MEQMRYYLTAEPDPVVPLAGQLVQLLRVVVEQDVQDILVSQLDATLKIYNLIYGRNFLKKILFWL